MSESTPRDRIDTLLAHIGRDPKMHSGFVNPAIHRGSTVVFETMAECIGAHDIDFKDGPYTYGLLGTPVERQLEEALATLDGGVGAVALGSGLAATTVSLMANLSAGDHMLMVDTCYWPTRKCCDDFLARMGVETTYYDPMIGVGVEALFRENTRVLFMESPGSRTFEIQDVPAMTKIAARNGVNTVIDNTWATPINFRPIEHGVDLVVHALTKYVAGHSDVMLGAIVARDREHWDRIKATAMDLGHGCSPDDAWLGLRGLRSLGTRLRRQGKSSLEVARWLEKRPEVECVLHPGISSCPGHDIFVRDFDGPSGLFSMVLKPVDEERLADMLEGLRFFSMGYSWGGYESLVLPFDPMENRTVAPWNREGRCLRISIGLEDPGDLIRDLEMGFKRLNNRTAG